MKIWCNTKIIDKLTLPEFNKIHDNIDTKNPMYWEIERNPSHEVISMKTNWPKENLELLDHKILFLWLRQAVLSNVFPPWWLGSSSLSVGEV